MAFSHLSYPAALFNTRLYQPSYDPALSLLDALMSENVPHAHILVKPKRQTSTDSSGKIVDPAADPSKFSVMLNVKHFKPEELTVKTVDNCIIIHGKHEENADEHGFISRAFTRRYPIPEDVEADQVKSSLSQDGVLTIFAPRKCLEPPPQNERVVPITVQQTAAVEQQQKFQEQLQQQQLETNEEASK